MEELKGRKVLVDSRMGKKLTTVSHVTPKGFLSIDKELYHQNGTRRGFQGYDIKTFRFITDEEELAYRKEFKRQRLVYRIKNTVNMNGLSLDQAERIMEILEEQEHEDQNRR